jgi:hypothetical protein
MLHTFVFSYREPGKELSEGFLAFPLHDVIRRAAFTKSFICRKRNLGAA